MTCSFSYKGISKEDCVNLCNDETNHLCTTYCSNKCKRKTLWEVTTESTTILVFHMRRGLASRNLRVARAKKTEGRRIKPTTLQMTRIKTPTVKDPKKKILMKRRKNLRADFQCSKMRWHIFKVGLFTRERHYFTKTRFCNPGKSAQTASSSLFLCSDCASSIFCRISL